MIHVYSFVFGPLEENTYILYDESGECIIIDPGCYILEERRELSAFIKAKNLYPVRLINTHCHLDHIMGNQYISSTYKIAPEYHAYEDSIIRNAPLFAENFGLDYELSPLADSFLKEGEILHFGKSKMDIFFTPGHSPGSLSFYNREDKILISGDVLFKGSIGRTDLPFGNSDQLMMSIIQVFGSLPDHTRVFSGHGLSTYLGIERETNPYLI